MVTSLSGGSDEANAVAIQPDGKIVIAGHSGTGAGLARYDADGFLDPTFGAGGTVQIALGLAGSNITSLLLLADGSILVGGWADLGLGGWPDFMAARFTPVGALDPEFGSSGVATIPIGTQHDEAYALAVQPDGRIVLAGCTLKPGTTWDLALARLTASGALDTSFGTSGKTTTEFAGRNDCARAVAVLPDGKIVAGGYATVNDPAVQETNFALARYTAAGALDATFGSGGTVTTDFGGAGLYQRADEGYGMAVQADGRIVLVGQAQTLDLAVARYLDDGSLDGSFGSYGLVRRDFAALDEQGDRARAVAIQPDGGIVVVGTGETTWNFGAESDWVILRYLP
jgi:uncharacterized delta-60 repeat protein